MPDFIGNKFFLLLKFTPIDTYLSLLSCCVTVGYQCDINVEVDYDLGDENGGSRKKDNIWAFGPILCLSLPPGVH